MFTTNSIAQNNIFETVRQIEIGEVVEQYTDTQLRWRGSRGVGLCPLHTEKTGSFTVYKESNSWHCYGCGAGGDSVAFVAKLFSLRPIDAARKIANDFGLQVEDRPLTKSEQRHLSEKLRHRELDRALDRWALKGYTSLCMLRRACFKVLETGKDFLEHPEYYNLMQYADHILDCLTGSEEDKKATLEMTINNQLGLAGRWMKSDRIY